MLGVCAVGVWSALGLYMDVPNGWHATLAVCANSSLGGATGTGGTDAYAEGALRASHVPVGADGRHVATYCNLNQLWFATAINIFVCLMSYINFLPIPWRVSCFAHLFCSRRPTHAGVDFYGRPTDALWFNIERRVRKRIAIGLNLAWICHFAALYTHLRWPEYIHIAWPYLLWHYLPLLLSISFQVSAARKQSTAEDRLIADNPERFPPRPMHYVMLGYRKWRKGKSSGLSLLASVRNELKELKTEARRSQRESFASRHTGIPRSATRTLERASSESAFVTPPTTPAPPPPSWRGMRHTVSPVSPAAPGTAPAAVVVGQTSRRGETSTAIVPACRKV